MEAPLSPSLKAPELRPPQGRRPPGMAWSGIPLGRILGMEIRIDTSWLIIFSLVLLSMVGYFSGTFPGMRPGPIWVVAAATTLMFFACLVFHEMSHALMARARGVEVRGITLFIFGGIAQLKEEPRRAKDEFVIAVVGPVVSAALGAIFQGISSFLPAASLGGVATRWLGGINFALALFNLLPGFPLDGGRILRAAVWGATKSLRRATRVASAMGSAVAFGLMFWGVLEALWRGRFIDGLWFGLIGWFLLVAARRSIGQMELQDNLRRLRVEQAMSSACPFVPDSMPVDRFVDEYVFKRGGRCFFATRDETLQGLLTLGDLRRIPREDWPGRTIGDVMVPFRQLKSVSASDSLLTAFDRMNEHGLDQLPVVDGDRVLGLITRDDIFRLMARFLELTEQPGTA